MDTKYDMLKSIAYKLNKFYTNFRILFLHLPILQTLA